MFRLTLAAALLAAAPGPQIREYPIPTRASSPDGIAFGSDGNLWFTEQTANAVARMTPDGSFREYPLSPGALAASIVAGPDGALWFTELNLSRIGRITTDGKLREFTLPTKRSGPNEIVAADGALWFSETGANKIGRITTSGKVT
jgi:virginiamycin B lyase